jgi:hypothetical protein
MVGIGRAAYAFMEARLEASSDVQAQAEAPPLQQLVLALDEEERCVRFQGGAILRGVAYAIVARLVRQRLESLAKGGTPWVTTKTLRGEASEETLRRRIARARAEFDRQMEPIWGFPPDVDDLIKSGKWRGYRLNPGILIVDIRQIANDHSEEREPRVSTARERGVA